MLLRLPDRSFVARVLVQAYRPHRRVFGSLQLAAIATLAELDIDLVAG
jgi:hypothetical protein